MANRLVAADASPLIGLAAAGAFDVLHSLFGQVTVTTTVRDEVLAGGELPGARELTNAVEDRWGHNRSHPHRHHQVCRSRRGRGEHADSCGAAWRSVSRADGRTVRSVMCPRAWGACRHRPRRRIACGQGSASRAEHPAILRALGAEQFPAFKRNRPRRAGTGRRMMHGDEDIARMI